MATIDTKKFLDEQGLGHLIGILKTKFSGIESKIPTDFYSKKEVDDAISAAKSAIIGGAGEDYDTLKEIETWVEEHQDLYEALVSGLATKANAADVYTKSEVYTQEEVDELLNSIDVTEELKDYAKTSEVTETLKDYYKKSETYSKSEVSSEIANAVKDFITEDALEGYATEEYVDDAIDGLSDVYQPKGDYLTEHQPLTEYAKSSAVTSEIEEAMNSITAITNAEIEALFE